MVNLDEGELPDSATFSGNMIGSQDFVFPPVSTMGELLALILQGDAFAELLDVSTAANAAAARLAVDNQEVNVALIIPTNFTDALMLPEETAVIELYHDPALTLGPAIVESVINQFADSFSTTKIGASVTLAQLAETGVVVDEGLAQTVIADLTAAVLSPAQAGAPSVVVQPPPGAARDGSLLSQLLGQILGGIMIFFAFFTGAGTLQNILVEEEKGTLSRLFTTPTPIPVILGGKALGTLITLAVQVTVLMFFGWLVFGIQWGGWLSVVLMAAGIILTSTATGLLLASLVTSTRQSGVIYGGVLTLTGMLGLITIFTGGQSSPTIRTITLLVPQGWTVQGLQTAMNGGSAAELLPTWAGLLVWIGVFTAVALFRLRRRFA
ncbi:MAG: hypothetical protein Fur0021_03810 [Candidatus Promineifilaceae bacterium]